MNFERVELSESDAEFRDEVDAFLAEHVTDEVRRRDRETGDNFDEGLHQAMAAAGWLAAELGMPEINYTMWHGLYVVKGTPKEIIAALNDAMRKAVTDPDVVAKFKQLGTVPFAEKDLSPEAHARLFAADLPRVAKLVEASGAKPSEAQ